MTEAVLKLQKEFSALISIEWLGSITGLVGAFLLATHSQYADYGFVFFLLSNMFFIRFAVQGKHVGLLVMQLGFTLTSIIGLYQGFIAL